MYRGIIYKFVIICCDGYKIIYWIKVDVNKVFDLIWVG